MFKLIYRRLDSRVILGARGMVDESLCDSALCPFRLFPIHASLSPPGTGAILIINGRLNKSSLSHASPDIFLEYTCRGFPAGIWCRPARGW
jgi:hypothetical protein